MNTSYAYLYDRFLSERKFEREVAALETRLNTYDLSGRISRLAMFRNPRDLLDGLVRQGTSTVVIVGSDETLGETISFLADLDLIVGFIPMAEGSEIAELLRLPVGSAAADVLAARYIETFDLGLLDDQYFLTQVCLPRTTASLEIEGAYRVSPTNGGSILIRNLGGRLGSSVIASDAKDGRLEAVVVPESDSPSWFKRGPRGVSVNKTLISFSRGTIQSSISFDLQFDGQTTSGSKFRLGIVQNKLRIITGRSGRRPQNAKLLPTRRKNANLRSAR